MSCHAAFLVVFTENPLQDVVGRPIEPTDLVGFMPGDRAKGRCLVGRLPRDRSLIDADRYHHARADIGAPPPPTVRGELATDLKFRELHRAAYHPRIDHTHAVAAYQPPGLAVTSLGAGHGSPPRKMQRSGGRYQGGT